MVFYPNLHLGKSLVHQLCWFFSWPETTEQSVIAGKLIVIPAARHTIIPCLPFLHNQRSSWGWHQLWRYSIWVAIWLPTSTDVAYCNLNIPWMVDEFTMNDCTKVLQSWQLSFAHYIRIPTVWAVLVPPAIFNPDWFDHLLCIPQTIHHHSKWGVGAKQKTPHNMAYLHQELWCIFAFSET